MSLLARFVVVGLLLAGIAAGWWRLTAHYERKGYDRAQAEYTAAALVASEKAREKEEALQKQVRKVSNDYQAEKIKRVSAERATADSLRDFQSALDNSTSSNTTTTSGANGTGELERELLGECANHLAAMALTADRLESKVVGLQSYAREVCVKAP